MMVSGPSRKPWNHQTFSWSPPLLLSILYLLLLPQATEPQQTASLDVPLYTIDKTLSHRQSVCDRAQQYDNGARGADSLHHALEGMQLNIAARNGLYFRYEDGILNQEYPGLMAVVLDELARRGRFTWRDSFAVYEGQGAGHTWTELALWQTEFFDVAADWWTESISRLKLGIAFPEGWYDASFILVSAKGEVASYTGINLFNWTMPFEPAVWILICFTLLWSGLVYMFLEYLAFPGQYTSKRGRESFGNDIFLSVLLFTQHFEFNPKTPSSRLFAVSMAFWALLISSAYTANLASFFVDQTQQSYLATSLDEAVRLGKPICIWDSTPQALLVQQQYPMGLYVKKIEEKDLYLGVNMGECALAVTTMTSYRDFTRKKEINPDCRLDWVGAPIQPGSAGFATKTDAGQKCTSLIHDVLNLHMLEMKDDGTLERMWNEHFARNLDHFCDAPTANVEQSQRRTVNEMGGTFALHFGVSIIAISVAVGTKFWKVYKKRKNNPQRVSALTKPKLPPNRLSMDNKTVEMNDSSKMFGDSDEDKRPTATFLQDFWGETSESQPWISRPRNISGHASGPLNKMQLMELIQDEFHIHQDHMEERIGEKLQQQQKQMEQKMQHQFAIMMDLLRQNQMGGSGSMNYSPKSPSEGDHFQSYPPGTHANSGAHNRGSHQNGSRGKQNYKANQVSHLLYPHEMLELRGATCEYFATADVSSPKDNVQRGIQIAKSTEEGNDSDEQEIRVSSMQWS